MITINDLIAGDVLSRLPGSGPVTTECHTREDGTSYLTASREGIPMLAGVNTDSGSDLARAIVDIIIPTDYAALEPIDDAIDCTDAAELTGYDLRYVARLCREGKLEARKVDGDWIISRNSCEVWVANRPAAGRPKMKAR